MGKASREKGRKGESEVVRIAKERGLSAERTAALQAGGLDHSDVVVAGRSLEVKRCQVLRFPEWLQKADRIVFRRNAEPWRVVIPFDEYLGLLDGRMDA